MEMIIDFDTCIACVIAYCIIAFGVGVLFADWMHHTDRW